jgi:hypothetical protein
MAHSVIGGERPAIRVAPPWVSTLKSAYPRSEGEGWICQRISVP